MGLNYTTPQTLETKGKLYSATKDTKKYYYDFLSNLPSINSKINTSVPKNITVSISVNPCRKIKFSVNSVPSVAKK
jgi:hypothetical protein